MDVLGFNVRFCKVKGLKNGLNNFNWACILIRGAVAVINISFIDVRPGIACGIKQGVILQKQETGLVPVDANGVKHFVNACYSFLQGRYQIHGKRILIIRIRQYKLITFYG